MIKWMKKDKLEYEFLPPALEIEETPPSPLQRGLIWLIVAITVLTILWSYFGKVDEVAVARGQVIPDGQVKVIQPLEEGIIRAIHVEEGQRVKEGQLLIELDSTIKKADVESNEKSLEVFKLEKQMLLAELRDEEVNDSLFLDGMNVEFSETLQLQNNLKKARESEYIAKEESLKSVIIQRENELRSLQSGLPLFEEAVRLVETEEKAFTSAYENGAISKMELINKQKELNLAKQKLEEQQKLVTNARDSIKQAANNLELLKKEWQKTLLNEIHEKDKAITAMEAEVTKARKRFELEKLTSPVSGTIHGLASYTIGGVVTPAQPVVTIVPEGTPLVVEATALNSDIGFLKVGQDVGVKLDTFPFQKYGTIKGKLVYISPDAVKDEKLGSVYKIRVELEKQSLPVNGREISISPGMTVSAEIKTGKRRIIEFFLSPIIKYAKESLTLR